MENEQKEFIKEVIIVEGRDDISAVKAAVNAEVIEVNGFAVKKAKTLEKIKTAYEKNGIIILTDPDFAGEQIRKTLNVNFPNAKNAFISRSEGTKAGDIGVENAIPIAIINALKKAKCAVESNVEPIFNISHMIDNGLLGMANSAEKRNIVGNRLGIGYSNGKQFLSRLNRYGISYDEFIQALD
ncbi:ribonuclease M5 [Fusobacterium sp. PH5-44]|uniref:ribonuclease M5 n=1 Tax=unclassified Fusobacterium TaxID=2648384 RepID=UPI003D1CEC58